METGGFCVTAYFLGLVIGTCSRSVVRGWFWAKRWVTNSPVTALRYTTFMGMVLAIAFSFRFVIDVVPLALVLTHRASGGITRLSLETRTLANFSLDFGRGIRQDGLRDEPAPWVKAHPNFLEPYSPK